MERIRLLIVDDHALLRDALRQMFENESDLVVVGEAGTAAEALEFAGRRGHDLLLLDLSLPDRSGIGVLAELRAAAPDARNLIVTEHGDSAYLRSAFAAGAAGYVVKTSGKAVLLEAIRSVSRGEPYIDPSLRGDTTERVQTKFDKEAPIESLSERERQVLLGLAQGLKYMTIAGNLGISVKTVETYRSRLTTKLGFESKADLMRFAIDSGMLGTAS